MVPVKPFLLISTRPEVDAARTEFNAMLRYCGLRPEDVVYVRLDRSPLPEVDLGALSGVIVGGSPYNTSDPDEDKSANQLRAEGELSGLLDRIVARDFPFFGACYGVGTLGVHQGGLIDHTHPEGVGAITVSLTDAGRADPLVRASGVPDSFDAFVGHKESVHRLPESAILLATGTTAPVQMFRVQTNQYATQFHPELDIDGITERIRIYRHNGYFDPSEMNSLIAQVSQAHVEESHRLLSAFVDLYAC